MPPSATDNDSWFFVSKSELDQQQDAAERRRTNATKMKEIVEVGVGSRWVPTGPEDFFEISWEDALLPEKDSEREPGSAGGEDVDDEELSASSQGLHPTQESPWANLKPGQKQRKQHDNTNRQPFRETHLNHKEARGRRRS